MSSAEFRTLEFTREFLENLVRLSSADGKRVVRALVLLDENERNPGLEVHQLQGELSGVGTAKASKGLRITFVRLHDGRKALLTCSQHHGD